MSELYNLICDMRQRIILSHELPPYVIIISEADFKQLQHSRDEKKHVKLKRYTRGRGYPVGVLPSFYIDDMKVIFKDTIPNANPDLRILIMSERNL